MNLQKSTPQLIFKAMILAAAVAAIISCGDPKYHPPAIVIAFSQGFIPPASLNTGAYAGIAATVTNDNTNGSVGFSCTPVGACGSFTPPSSSSGIPVCYLAPDAVPMGGTVTVTATSGADVTKFTSATITILSGTPQACP